MSITTLNSLIPHSELITSKTVGNSSGITQVFESNYVVNPSRYPLSTLNNFLSAGTTSGFTTFTQSDYNNTGSIFTFNVPVYNISGATSDFYTQTTAGISTNSSNIKVISYYFDSTLYSASTNSLSGATSGGTGSTIFHHDIYRLDYPTFTAATFAATQTTAGTSSIEFQDAINELSEPIVSYQITGTPLTQSAFLANQSLQTIDQVAMYQVGVFSSYTQYNLLLPQKIKPTGSYTINLFEDKSQYFIDSFFYIPTLVDRTLTGYKAIDNGSTVTLSASTGTTYLPSLSYNTGTTSYYSSSPYPTVISGGTYQGIGVHGAYFVYFINPTTPNLNILNDGPYISGPLPTYTPIFGFNNVDGDYYKLQVNYNTADTNFSSSYTQSSSIVTYNIPQQTGDPEFIRTFSVPLNPSSPMLYRIGNTKEIINIFGIKNSVTTWSSIYSATTAGNGTFTISGTVYLGGISGLFVPGAIISIKINNTSSSVDFGADSLQDPNINSESTTAQNGNVGDTLVCVSDINGNFSLSNINTGIYELSIAYPATPPYIQSNGYTIYSASTINNNLGIINPGQTTNINLTANTVLDFVFAVNWSDTPIPIEMSAGTYGNASYNFMSEIFFSGTT